MLNDKETIGEHRLGGWNFIGEDGVTGEAIISHRMSY